MVFVVAGVSGNTGSVVAQNLFHQGKTIRVIVRSEDKGKPWAEKGAEVAVSDLSDPEALTKALSGAEGAYLLNPPSYHTKDMIEDARIVAESFKKAIEASGLPKVVILSSVGSEYPDTGNIKTTYVLEQVLSDLSIPITFLRAPWFMENWVSSAKYEAPSGTFYSYLQPLDLKIAMASSVDIGNTIGRLLTETWSGKRIINLVGPEEYSANDVAQAFSKALGKPVVAALRPRDQWITTITTTWHMPENVAHNWAEMFDGFNSGHISQQEHLPKIRGEVTLDEAVASWLKK